MFSNFQSVLEFAHTPGQNLRAHITWSGNDFTIVATGILIYHETKGASSGRIALTPQSWLASENNSPFHVYEMMKVVFNGTMAPAFNLQPTFNVQIRSARPGILSSALTLPFGNGNLMQCDALLEITRGGGILVVPLTECGSQLLGVVPETSDVFSVSFIQEMIPR